MGEKRRLISGMWEKQWLPRQEKVLPSVKFQWEWVGRDFSGKCWRAGESAVYMETRTSCVGESESWIQITWFKSLFCYLVPEWPWALHLTFYFFSYYLNRDDSSNTQHFRSVLENTVSGETCSLFILQYIVFPWKLYDHYNKFNSYSNKRSFTFFGGSSGGHSKRIWRVREEWKTGWSEAGPGHCWGWWYRRQVARWAYTPATSGWKEW